MQHVLTLHTPSAAREYYRTGVWQSETLYSLLQKHARERGAAYALRDAAHRLSWARLLAWVDAVAHDLDQAGVRPGERVSVWLPSRVEWMIVLLACSRNGYMCNPSLHQNYTVGEIVTLLSRIQARALFAQVGYGADGKQHSVFELVKEVAALKRVYALPGEARGEAPYTYPYPAANAVAAGRAPDLDPDKVVYLAFTSGTTGIPKGVMHSDNTLLANGRAMVRDWHHDKGTVLLSLSPSSHHIATVALEQALVGGFELVLNDPAVGKPAIDWIEESGATYVMGVPTHAIDIQATMRARNQKKLGRVTVFYMAGAPIPKEIAQRFLDTGIVPQNIYGMTENGSHQYTLPADDAQTITATCGRACHGYEVKLWKQDNPDAEAVPSEIGEIGGRGGVLTLGYFAAQEVTENSFNARGWFMSGDLGRFDEKGCLQIVGRKKDLIIRGGHNIYPARIEDLAHRHAGVAKAAVVPVPDERLGERVCLSIIPVAGAQPSGEELLDHLHAAGLSKYDMPEFFLCMTAFTLTASGKILKRELAQWIRSGQVQPLPVRWRERERAKS
ncbi:MAG: cyclohexanecarboxylate-CoA ligase [Betaproteobacteria bacterium]|nr:cyclohexanecarboxylate-CoA ligase [Betaproteobacteria bacterium]